MIKRPHRILVEKITLKQFPCCLETEEVNKWKFNFFHINSEGFFSLPDQQELPVGLHTFNFSFQLPHNIPSTFSNLFGKILYEIKVEIERKLKFNYSFKFPFTVMSHLDLNCESGEIGQPLRGEVFKKFYLGFGSPLTLSAQIPFRGYVAGQNLTICVKVVNESTVAVEEIFLELRRLCTFKADFSISTKNYSHLLVKGSSNGVGVAEKSSTEFNFDLEIPPVEATNIRFSKYVLVNYGIVIIAKPRGAHRDVFLNIPITIGTIPLKAIKK
jgi:hypothetical protein